MKDKGRLTQNSGWSSPVGGRTMLRKGAHALWRYCEVLFPKVDPRVTSIPVPSAVHAHYILFTEMIIPHLEKREFIAKFPSGEKLVWHC